MGWHKKDKNVFSFCVWRCQKKIWRCRKKQSTTQQKQTLKPLPTCIAAEVWYWFDLLKLKVMEMEMEIEAEKQHKFDVDLGNLMAFDSNHTFPSQPPLSRYQGTHLPSSSSSLGFFVFDTVFAYVYSTQGAPRQPVFTESHSPGSSCCRCPLYLTINRRCRWPPCQLACATN